MKTQNKAFTLVELIIVITILAILATIGFMSFQSYTIDARDGKRKRDLRELRNGLELYQAKKASLPMPDNYATLSSGTTIGYQGYAGVSVLLSLRAGDTFQDPLDKQYYTYSVDTDKTNYKLLAMLEQNLNTTSYNDVIVNQTYAIDYTNRYTYIIGQGIGIYLSGTIKTPVQEGNSGTMVTVTDSNITVVTSNTEAIASVPTPTTPTSSQWKDIAGTNCTNSDITIGTQTWAGCNSVLGNGLIYNADNYCWNYAGTDLQGTACYGDITKENAYNSTYGEDNIWGKLYLWSTLSTECKNPTGGNFTNITSSTINCACPSGWHVPTQQDFLTLEQNLTCSDYTTDLTRRCTGLGWSGKSSKTASNNIIKALKLPLAGYRNDGAFYDRGYYGDLRSSTEYNSTSARIRELDRSQAGVSSYFRNKSTFGFSVRCIKD